MWVGFTVDWKERRLQVSWQLEAACGCCGRVPSKVVGANRMLYGLERVAWAGAASGFFLEESRVLPRVDPVETVDDSSMMWTTSHITPLSRAYAEAKNLNLN